MPAFFLGSGRARIGAGVLAAALAGFIAGCASVGQGTARPTDPVVVHDTSGFQGAIAAVSDAALPCVVHIDVAGTTLRQVPRSGPLGFFFFSPQPWG
jgi:hypothetical protein